MADITTGTLKRKYMAHYIDASATSTAAYERLGKDLEEFTIEMGANVNSIKNILGESSVSIDNYEKTASVEPYKAEAGSALFLKLQDIIDNEKTLDDLNTTVLEVHLWDEVEATAGSYIAYKENAVIEVKSYGGDTSAYQIPYDIHMTGGRTKGTFVLATKAFTADV